MANTFNWVDWFNSTWTKVNTYMVTENGPKAIGTRLIPTALLIRQ